MNAPRPATQSHERLSSPHNSLTHPPQPVTKKPQHPPVVHDVGVGVEHGAHAVAHKHTNHAVLVVVSNGVDGLPNHIEGHTCTRKCQVDGQTGLEGVMEVVVWWCGGGAAIYLHPYEATSS